ncbi:MAG TPA: UDP-3-O-(3-hydroxymyristoyl)glucosamine N-acyltransferase [Candidatus Sulfotelmatobacter sp.]|jgi:UDP-3-O-[3-hydroxymyristoyl] glucosamine N-acyltransferase|nr:UDP-3-O-(3-hydroxymyristoyl)glucosamine N-acyltransferase [Candidatus Sulfotelmatobacter sp.]
MKLHEIAKILGCELAGNGEIEITGVAGLEEAGPSELSFLANPRYLPKLKTTRAAAVILDRKEHTDAGAVPAALLSVNPYLDFARALDLFYKPPRPVPGIHPTAVISPTASLGAGASIGPHVFIGDGVRIGSNAVLHAHVVIYEGVQIGDDFLAHSHAVVREFCRIGNRVILQNGAIIGSDGYGFARKPDGAHYKIAQAGIVVIEDDVEIQANSCIDRAAVGETRIGRGSKIDNLVQIGHACRIGENAIICSQAGIAGSTTLGNNVVLAGQVGIINHLHIGDGVLVTAQSGVGHDVPAGQKISGSPAFDNRRWLRSTAVFERLPELQRAVRQLEAEKKQS